MKELIINNELLFIIGILTLIITLIIAFIRNAYHRSKPRTYTAGESIKYIRNQQERESEIVNVFASHLTVKNGDVVFYRDVL